MNGKRWYVLALLCMALLIAFGLWVMIHGMIEYRNRPLVEFYTRWYENISAIPSNWGGVGA